ncbi:MAG: TIGR00730 family Rossman fold protein [Cyclobacteriaceae bacterium]
MENKTLAVFCGSKKGNNPTYTSAAIELAREMVNRNINLVYGGGKVGLMGEIANEIMKLGGQVFGVIPEKLMQMEVGHSEITDLKVVKTMHERKALMAEMSDAFLAIPGGIGTLEEIIEVFTWQQIGYHEKPCAFLNTANYYQNLFSFIDGMVDNQFLEPEQRDKLIIEDSPEKILSRIFAS